jgi:hypothetical protein
MPHKLVKIMKRVFFIISPAWEWCGTINKPLQLVSPNGHFMNHWSFSLKVPHDLCLCLTVLLTPNNKSGGADYELWIRINDN